jgi:hypothetical protein
MATMLRLLKAESAMLRRVQFLPRVGMTVELGGRVLVFKHTPTLETLLNLKDRGFSLKNLTKLAIEELEEIRYPVLKRGLAAVKDLGEKAKVLKKAPVRAAAKKKPEEASASV